MPKTEDADIGSCSELIQWVADRKEQIIRQGNAREDVRFYRFWYRGHRWGDEWRLEPGGLRHPYKAYDSRVRSALFEFRAEATAILPNPPPHEDLGKWLFLMRHHGMPTYLLDWTRSPLIGLYFAVGGIDEEPDEEDGALWVLRPGIWTAHSKINYGNPSLLEAYHGKLAPFFVAHFCERRGTTWKEEDAARVVPLEPVYTSPRMIAQQSVFTIHGPCSKPMENFAHGYKSSCLWKLRIPREAKSHLRNELFDLGIRESALFPDLDHLAKCVVGRYQKTTGQGRGSPSHVTKD